MFPRRALLLAVFALCVACSTSVDDRDAVSRAPSGKVDSVEGCDSCVGAQLDLVSGERVFGELIGLYDHTQWWWTPGDELTYAVFDPANLAPYPNDASVRFVSSSELASIQPWAIPAGRSSYRASLRDRGVVLERSPLDAVAYVITGHESYHTQEDGYGDYAWDLGRTDTDGARCSGDCADNADYFVWDSPVYLPSAGTVVTVRRSEPDNVPGSYPDSAPNNEVTVHLFGFFYLQLLHFRADTIPADIEPGDWLPAGTYLGRVGNSGVTLEPHLHITALWWDESSQRSWSVPIEMSDLFTSDGPHGAVLHEFVEPDSGTWVSSVSF